MGVLDGGDEALSQPRNLATTKTVGYEESRINQNNREKKRRREWVCVSRR
jgi:hypothetical protein